MESYNEQPEEMKKKIQRKVTEEVIKRYLAIQNMKSNENDRVYKLKKSNYEKLYNDLDPEMRAECEAEVNKEIEEGRLDLDNFLTGLDAVKKR